MSDHEDYCPQSWTWIKKKDLGEILEGRALTVRLTGIVCGVLSAPGSLTVMVAEYVPGDRDEVE